MSESEKEQKAQKIKSSIASSCEYVREKDINVTHDVSKFTSANRNTSTGQIAVWVLVEVPEIPVIKPDSYYERNQHLRKPSEDAVEETKDRIEIIEAVCQRVAKINGAEYIGYNSKYEGFDSKHGSTRYLNIRIE